MKYLVLALFVTVAAAAPTPEANGEPVELIIHGVQEGEALELGDVVDIKLKEHQDGVLASSTDLLHPLTAAGIAEAAIAAEAAQPEIVPSPVQIVDNQPEIEPSPVQIIDNQEVPVPEPIAVQPIPDVDEVVPDEIAIIPIPDDGQPAPETVDVIPIELLPPKPPMVIEEIEVAPIVLPEPIPEPAPQVPEGEIFNNDLVQVQVNGLEDSGMISTIQSWFSMFVNYINNGIQTTQQIV